MPHPDSTSPRPTPGLSATHTCPGTFRLGRYRVLEEIGAGGMATVHLARADGPGGFRKWVALKRIHRHLADDRAFVNMFLDEARVGASLSHPNVAQVFDLGRSGATFWIAMEYLHGEPLGEVIRARAEQGRPAMKVALATKLVADAAEGLHAAHELQGHDGQPLNLVHRDISPHNVFVTYDGAVKLVDFGIAKGEGRLACTRVGTLKGKLAYMSPEQARGRTVDRRTDVFALGVVLWEMVTGRRLFRGHSELQTLERVQQCHVPVPSTWLRGFPLELEAILMRALARRREARFPTARDFSRALSEFLVRSGVHVGYEEIGSHMRRVLPARYRAREALLRWAGGRELRTGPPPPPVRDAARAAATRPPGSQSAAALAPTVRRRRDGSETTVATAEDADDQATRILPRVRAEALPASLPPAAVLRRIGVARGSAQAPPLPAPSPTDPSTLPVPLCRRTLQRAGARARAPTVPVRLIAAATAAVAATLLVLATLQ